MQKIHRKTQMPKFDFNKVAKNSLLLFLFLIFKEKQSKIQKYFKYRKTLKEKEILFRNGLDNSFFENFLYNKLFLNFWNFVTLLY